MRKSNLNYEQLIEIAPKDRPFQVEVQWLNKTIGTSWAMLSPVMWANPEQNKIKLHYELFAQDQNNKFYLTTEYDFLGTFTLIDEYRNMYEFSCDCCCNCKCK